MVSCVSILIMALPQMHYKELHQSPFKTLGQKWRPFQTASELGIKVRRKENISGSRVREDRTKSIPEVEKLCELKFGNRFFFFEACYCNKSEYRRICWHSTWEFYMQTKYLNLSFSEEFISFFILIDIVYIRWKY